MFSLLLILERKQTSKDAGRLKMVWPHGDPAALSLIFPTSPTTQTGASRRLQSTGSVFTGNLNSTQQMFKSNERQRTHTHLKHLHEKNVFMTTSWTKFSSNSSFVAAAVWSSSQKPVHTIQKTHCLTVGVWAWIFVDLDITYYKQLVVLANVNINNGDCVGSEGMRL